MRNTVIGTLLCLLLGAVLFGQQVGDQYTAGYTFGRTYVNGDQGDFGPPLTLSRTIELSTVDDARSLIVFESGGTYHLLVGYENPATVDYSLFNEETGALEWGPVTFPRFGGNLNYIPSMSDDIVLLGGPATTTVSAVRVSSGTTLWADTSVGEAEGRYPILTNGMALYHGRNGLTAADPLTGMPFWKFATTTAVAPIAAFGQQVYLLEESGNLRALDTADGSQRWSIGNLNGGQNPSIIATEGAVFINKTSDNTFGSFAASNGLLIWGQPGNDLSETPGMGLAYDQLLLFINDDGTGNGGVSARNPDTGATLWTALESGAGVDYGGVANNVIYYYHQASERIRARDAFGGGLLWSLRRPGVRGLSLANGQLYVLLSDRVEIYRAPNLIYFAHMAEGGGQRTLTELANLSDGLAEGTLSYFDTQGNPLLVDVEGVGNNVSTVTFSIPPNGSTSINTLGRGAARSGWSRVVSDQPLRGSSIFQFSNDTTFAEAGVASSTLTGEAVIHVDRINLPVGPAPAGQATINISTGVGVANPSDETADLLYRLLDSTGTEIDTAIRTLGPSAQEAIFVEQIFAITPDFTGTVVIESEVPFVVTALRTGNGLQLSSVP